jgi:hypothetical protein
MPKFIDFYEFKSLLLYTKQKFREEVVDCIDIKGKYESLTVTTLNKSDKVLDCQAFLDFKMGNGNYSN